MQKTALVLALFLGFSAREASAYEAGIGAGYISACIERGGNLSHICVSGPTVSGQWGFNLWGKGYDIAAHEQPSADPLVSTEDDESSDLDGTHFYSSPYHGFNLGLQGDDWRTVAAVIVAALFMVSIGYALVYPFSSRADIGFIGRAAYQSDSDIDILRSEAGIYFRGYLSQHFPMYIYGSGLFSHQNISIYDQDSEHNVFVKRLGLGFMSPDKAGLYFQGTWERSSLLDPSVKDVVSDATTEKLKKQSIKKILDASHFELGYIWYY